MIDSRYISYFDETGSFVRGAFWELSVPISLCDGTAADELRFVDETLYSLHPEPNELFYAEVLPQWNKHHDCTQDPAHITSYELVAVHADLFGGPQLSDFVVDVNDAGIVVSASLLNRLRDSGLCGIEAMPVKIKVNQSSFPDPMLLMLTSRGPKCIRERIVRAPDPNRCLHCGWGPVVCPGCGQLAVYCEGCGQQLAVSRWEATDSASSRL